MPFTIERNDLARVRVDAIVITANEGLQITGGVGLSVARAAGLVEMQAACDALGGCPTGQAVATPAFALPAKHVVHVVGPVWQGGAQGEEALLRQAYDSALACADECGARTIALPLISAHTFGCPVRLSFVIAVEAIKAFLEDHDDTEVRLVLFGDDAMAVGQSFYDNIAQYIDSHYVERTYEPRNSAQGAPYRDDRSSADSQYAARRAQAKAERAYSHSRRQSALPSMSSRPESSQREALPSAAKGRHGVFSRISEAVEEARDRISELRKPPKDKPRPGTCIVRDEQEEYLGPYLSTEQYWRIQDEAEEASWRAGVCPVCKVSVEGMNYCPNCGRSVPPYALQPDATGAFAPIEASTQESEFVFSDAPVEADWGAAPTLFEDGDEGSCLDWGESFAPRQEAECQLDAAFEERAAPSLSAQQAAPSAAPQAASAQKPSGGSLKSWLDQLDAPFSTTLLALIDERGMTDAEVYKRANMSRQLFSKIRCDAGYRPTKKTVLALAIALGLDLGETVDLLQRAGFALSHSSKADVIVEYFIVNGNHDIFAVNEALYAFDQPLL